MTLITSLVPCAATMTPASPSMPHATPTSSASASVLRVSPMTPHVASSVVPVSPLATQLVPRMLPAGVVPISPMVHLLSMFSTTQALCRCNSLLSESQFGPPSPILIGGRLWRKNTLLSCPTTLGTWFRTPVTPMLS
jgi:hypothetical protein